MNSNELVVIPNHIVIRTPQKSFYKKYTHKLQFEAVKEKASTSFINNGHYNWRARRSNYYNVNVEITSIIRNILDEYQESKLDYRIRQEGCTVNLYFNDNLILELMLRDRIVSNIVMLYRPLNPKHAEYMEIDNKIRVRKSLFNKQYRYKLYIKNTAKFRKEELYNFRVWLEATYPDEHRAKTNVGLELCFAMDLNTLNKKPNWRTSNTTLAVYFNEDIDLMMAKLRLNEYVSHVEEAVLVSEL
jgi:hypothetical protein